MGASSIRKEVRKRKFGTAEPSSVPATREEQHEPSPAISPPKDTTPNPVVEEKDPTESPADDPETQETKPHRFVVFVGTSITLAHTYQASKEVICDRSFLIIYLIQAIYPTAPRTLPSSAISPI